jgi:tRNA threonylcarbamoyladenosine biosynthesis protein TsaE
MKIILSKNYYETQTVGKKLAEEILKLDRKNFRILALRGDLGGGKTTFLQGFAKGLEIKEKILSPTFVIMKKFEIKNKKSKFKYFYHLDCYRIKKTEEILKIGFKEIISDFKNIIAIEWAEKIKKILPKKIIWIKFEFINKNTRKIIIS